MQHQVNLYNGRLPTIDTDQIILDGLLFDQM